MDGTMLLRCRREERGVTILRLLSSAPSVVLPEELWGLPVTAIAGHAFAPGGDTGEGELVAFGPQGETDNRRIRSVTLPQSVCSVGDYAFYNCTSLRSLTLSGDTERWGGCALMNCTELRSLHIHLSGETSSAMAYFADELPWELDMTLSYPDGGTARLIFPGYRESYEENSPAHHFDYFIHGAGYPYHHCFQDKHFSFFRYDSLWQPFLQMDHEPDCALRLACCRLRHPRELSKEAGAEYLRYLRAHSGDAMGWFIDQRDADGLSWALPLLQPDRDALSAACALARETGATEALALLLEERHRRFAAGSSAAFDL